MPSVQRMFRSGFFPAALVLAVLATGFAPALAQQEEAADAPAAIDQGNDSGRLKHPYFLAFDGGVSFWAPLHIVKEDVFDINDLTDPTLGFHAGISVFPMDGMCLSVRGHFGGLDFTGAKPGEMAVAGAALEGGQLTPDSHMKMTGVSFGLQAFVGSVMWPDSRFNPYFRSQVLYLDWALQDEKGGETLMIDGEPLEGTDMGVGLGLGTEYRLGRRVNLTFEWMWNFYLTSDETTWDYEYWTNTHVWELSAGLRIGL